MSATRNPLPMRGVNVVLRRDGSEIHLDDIETAAHGQEILDEIDAAILVIEDQLDHDGGRGGEEWRRRATAALKKKRRIRPALQHRIAELRRGERIAAGGCRPAGTTSPPAARPQAFVAAAEDLLEAEVVTAIWARAAEMRPAVFSGDGSR